MKNIKNILTLGFSLAMSISLHACEKPIGKNQKETAPLALRQDAAPTVEKHQIRVALLLDTSNSMDGLINQAKAQLWEIVNELSYAKCGTAKPNLQIGLYEYGNDGLSSHEGYIRQVIGFTDDLDAISERLFSLTTNGGSEFCGHVIQTSVNQLDWGNSADDLNLIFIAGNEPFTQGRIDYRDAISGAKEKDIVINTIFCGNYDQGISGNWRDGAMRGNGDYMVIDQNQEIVHITTPYDDVILKLNKKLNHTYIPYGHYGSSKSAMQRSEDANAQSMNEAVAVKRAVSKSSRLYKNKKWDLVDAAEDDESVLEEVEVEELPEALKGKSKEELKRYVTEKSEERQKIQKEIQELNKKRQAYITAQQKEQQKDVLDNVMINAIKKQAKRKNYSW